MKKYITAFVMSGWLFASSISAQVTIGSDAEPVRTMILQIKNTDPIDPKIDNTNASEGGLGISRVALIKHSTLEPFINPSDSEYSNQKLLSTGLVVYNLTTDLDEELEPGVYVWTGARWQNIRTRPTEFWLNIAKTELIFPSAVGVTVPTQSLPIIWEPKSRVCEFALTPTLNGGIKGYTPPAQTDKSGNFPLNIQIAPMTAAEISNDIFYEKSSTLKVTATNLLGNQIYEEVKLRQINYALVATGMKRYPVFGRTYVVDVASNTDWVVTLNDPNGIIQSYTPNIGGNNTAGEEFTFTMVSDENKAGKEASFTISNPDNKFPPQVYQMTATPNDPTVYMVPSGGVIDIPVRKVWAVWKDDLETELSGPVRVIVYWADTPNLITSATPINANAGINSTIRVQTNSGVASGNAVILLYVNEIVRWSWHIWVSNYNPGDGSAAINAGSTAVPGGLIYKYNNGTKDNIFMDRYMGAVSSVPGQVGTLGMHYQWGRKDPFVTFTDLSATIERPVYGSHIGKMEVAPAPNHKNGIAASIQRPSTFYTSQPGTDLDWYSALPNTHKDDLWLNADGTKSFYDPCPKGWRVPPVTGNATSPWYGLSTPTFNATTNGYTWPQVGFYPVTGYRYLGSGGTSHANGLTTMLLATGVRPYAYQVEVTGFAGVRFTPALVASRGHGLSLRCVKE